MCVMGVAIKVKPRGNNYQILGSVRPLTYILCDYNLNNAGIIITNQQCQLTIKFNKNNKRW